MKRLFTFLSATIMLLFAGCGEEYVDPNVLNRLDNLEDRLERLEELCLKLNTNIASLQTIITALQNNDYITGITPITKAGEVIGYTISFTKSAPITIYHGEDGKDGQNGQNGQDGKDGSTPVIGVRQDSDNIYYWTVNGEWLLDENGNKIKAEGKDGKDGENGQNGTNGTNGTNGENGKDGKDGITPQLKIENDYWMISYDNGTSWTQLGKATGEKGEKGEKGDQTFRSVTQDENNVYFTLNDGTTITVPRNIVLSIAFDEADLVVMSPNSTHNIGYTVTSATDNVKVEVTSSADIKAKIVADNENGLTGKIEVKTSETIDEYSKVIVFVSNDNKVIMRSFTFEETGLVIEENTTKIASAEGGEVTLEFLSNVACEAVIPEDAQEWISVVPNTRSMEKKTITLKIEPNPSLDRNATITIQASDSALKLEYYIKQEGGLIEIDSITPPNDEIWYISSDGKIIEPRTPNVFGANIISNIYKSGKGIIKFDGDVTKIGEKAFWYPDREEFLTNVYVPESVTEIGNNAFNGCSALVEFTIPSNVTRIGQAAFFSPWQSKLTKITNKSKVLSEIGNGAFRCDYLYEFIGRLVSDDGRCLINNGKVIAFAKGGLTEYTIPEEVIMIGDYVFQDCDKLTKVTIPNGVISIGESAFDGCTNLSDLNIPQNITHIGQNAFRRIAICSITFPKMLQSIPESVCASCPNLKEVHFGEYITSISNYAFTSCINLEKIDIPQSVKSIGINILSGCPKLSSITGKFATGDNRALIIDGTLLAIAPYQLTEYAIPEDVKTIAESVFSGYSNITKVTIPEGVTKICMHAFNGCGLTSLTLPSSLKYIENFMFLNNDKLSEVYCLAQTPPGLSGTWFNAGIFNEGVIVRVPKGSVAAYQAASIWNLYRIMEFDEEIYSSTDFSQDGKVTMLQRATLGNGIDIVIMGDGYSDRQIVSGKYNNDISKALDMLFNEEPYQSLRNHFNIYQVTAVSIGEGYGAGTTAFNGYFGNGTLVGGNNTKVLQYTQKAINANRVDNALIIVMMNREYYAGTCYMYYPSTTSDCGLGTSISYFPLGTDDAMLAGLICHEAGGHGFSKLADEYSYEYIGEIDSSDVTTHKSQQNNWGWWKNVDFTSDPTKVRWAYFLSDTRYANEGLGVYEGGLTYWSGVWRPSENSIMRHNTGGFNAPSREAIYYRIHKLAYGDSWQYDYEEFVKWDAKNRTSAAMRAMVYKPTNYKPTHPPIIVNKSWKDAK